MKFFNIILIGILIVIPAGLFWMDCWVNEETPKQKYDEVMIELDWVSLATDIDKHTELMEAFQEKRITKSEYVREMKKLQKKLEREANQAEKKVHRMGASAQAQRPHIQGGGRCRDFAKRKTGDGYGDRQWNRGGQPPVKLTTKVFKDFCG